MYVIMSKIFALKLFIIYNYDLAFKLHFSFQEFNYVASYRCTSCMITIFVNNTDYQNDDKYLIWQIVINVRENPGEHPV